jgi:hypothetical protein
MADMTKVKVTLNSGVAVNVSSPDNSLLTVAEVGGVLNVSNSDAQIIASFSTAAVAYWTTDLAELS